MQINNSMVALAAPIHHVVKVEGKKEEELVKKEKDETKDEENLVKDEVIRETVEEKEVNKYI